MTSTTTLRLDHLSLRNFRCFAECTIDLHPQLTVLVAENGQGKTAVLDALRIALGPFVDTISGMRQHADLTLMDVRLIRDEQGRMKSALLTNFAADGYVNDKRVRWSRSLRSDRTQARSTTKHIEELRQVAQSFGDRIEEYGANGSEDPPTLPIVAYYGTQRLWSQDGLARKERRYSRRYIERLSGYDDSLASSSSIMNTLDWYETKMNQTGDPRFSTERPQKVLAAVEEAMRVVLKPTGWSKLSWDSVRNHLLVKHPEQGSLPLSMLSDGVRTMVALVIDIARRCAILNPHLGEETARQTPGILLIDEVDMHLHPRWQQQVVALLHQAFPTMQMVLSTHSPQVLTTLRKENIRILANDGNGKWTAQEPSISPLAHEAGDALAHIMDTHPRPEITSILSDVHAYEQLVRAGRGTSEEARHILSRLDVAGFEFSDADQRLFNFLTRKATNSEAPNQ